jgi:hypothetical protein
MLQGDSLHDYILVDGFDRQRARRRARHPALLPGLSCAPERERLLAVNLLGRERGFEASAERISQAFDGRALVFPSCDSGNTIAFASAGDPVDIRFDELIRRARQCRQETGLNLLPTVARLQQERHLPSDLAQGLMPEDHLDPLVSMPERPPASQDGYTRRLPPCLRQPCSQSGQAMTQPILRTDR